MNQRSISLILVVLAGEAIFMLPFMIPRLFRPLMLQAWNVTNTEFGTAFAAYGILAMISYLLGGPFADKYHPRTLISASLAMTAFGGLFLMHSPSAANLILTYGFFGVSTTFLMWGALIKTTHIVGGEAQRSLAMGILDGGRGLTAAAFGSVLVFLMSRTTPDLSTSSQQMASLRIIYLATVAFTLLIALGVWISLKNFVGNEGSWLHWDLRKAVACLKNPDVGLLSLLVLGAYCGFKGVDNYATYMVNVHGIDLSSSALFTSMVFWLRPIGALTAGAFADRYHRKNPGGRFVAMFGLLLVGGLLQLLLAFTGGISFWYAFTVVIFSAAFAFAVRAIYFSVFGDLKIPHSLIGTTIGIISFVGFTPDIFFGWVTGRWIDAYPGAAGFKMSFLFTAAMLLAGAVASLILYFRRSVSRK